MEFNLKLLNCYPQERWVHLVFYAGNLNILSYIFHKDRFPWCRLDLALIPASSGTRIFS